MTLLPQERDLLAALNQLEHNISRTNVEVQNQLAAIDKRLDKLQEHVVSVELKVRLCVADPDCVCVCACVCVCVCVCVCASFK